MTPNRVLITGATGLVGGAVALEMLNNTDAEIVCLVRGQTALECEERLEHALTVAAHAYGMHATADQIRHRCRAVPGDLSDPTSLEPAGYPNVDLMIHAAASLKYANRDISEINAINVGGTIEALKLAKATHAGAYCHVSTAYVAGARSGTIREADPLPDDASLNNFYEQSKVAAERLVNEADVLSMIVRLSIVIGHSKTFHATSFSGMYGMIDEITRFKDRVGERLGNYLTFNPVRVLASPEAALNLIPVDTAASAIARIALSKEPGVYHVVNRTPPTVRSCFEVGFEALGLPAPRYVERDSQLTELDRKLQTEFYDSYLKNGKRFDTSNADTILAQDALNARLTDADIADHVHWYLNSGHRRGQRLLTV